MSKKIGFLITDFSGNGGTERVTSILSNGLSERNYNVTIYSIRNGDIGRFYTKDNVELVSLHGENVKNPVLRKIVIYQKLKRDVINKKIDIMIAVDVALYLYLFLLQKKKICKCIGWEHFNCLTDFGGFVNFSRKFAAKFADYIVVLSKYDLCNYEVKYKKTNRIKYIYNPVTFVGRKKTDLSKKRVLAVGRLTPQKGFDMLLDAWKEVEKNNQEWELEIVGEGRLETELNRQIQNNDLKRCRLAGYSKDVEQEYLNASIYVLSSRYEGLPLVVIEALSKGLPVVAFDCEGGIRELVYNNENGYLIDNANIHMLADKLLELMENRNVLEKFSSNTEKYIKKLSLESIMNEWIELLDEV